MKVYIKVKIMDGHFSQKFRFIFMIKSRDFHDDTSRFHLFFPGVTQENENAGSVRTWTHGESKIFLNNPSAGKLLFRPSASYNKF